MRHAALLVGVLLTAAPPTVRSEDARSAASYLLKFTLDETGAEVAKKMGNPAQVADFSAEYFAWQFQIDVKDLHDFSHTFCFRRKDGALVSITRSYEEDTVDELFPPSETSVHYWPSAQDAQYGIRLRRLSGERLLMALGSTKSGQPVSQLILIRRSAVQFFMPWLAAELEKREKAQ